MARECVCRRCADLTKKLRESNIGAVQSDGIQNGVVLASLLASIDVLTDLLHGWDAGTHTDIHT